MPNVTGDKTVTIDGKTLTLRYTWAAIAEIEAQFGDIPDLNKSENVARIAAIGLRDRHPEYTAERIMELSPPFVPFMAAVQEAIASAYFGNEPIPDPEEQKKSLRRGGWWSRFRRRSRQV